MRAARRESGGGGAAGFAACLPSAPRHLGLACVCSSVAAARGQRRGGAVGSAACDLPCLPACDASHGLVACETFPGSACLHAAGSAGRPASLRTACARGANAHARATCARPTHLFPCASALCYWASTRSASRAPPSVCAPAAGRDQGRPSCQALGAQLPPAVWAGAQTASSEPCAVLGHARRLVPCMIPAPWQPAPLAARNYNRVCACAFPGSSSGSSSRHQRSARRRTAPRGTPPFSPCNSIPCQASPSVCVHATFLAACVRPGCVRPGFLGGTFFGDENCIAPLPARWRRSP